MACENMTPFQAVSSQEDGERKSRSSQVSRQVGDHGCAAKRRRIKTVEAGHPKRWEICESAYEGISRKMARNLHALHKVVRCNEEVEQRLSLGPWVLS